MEYCSLDDAFPASGTAAAGCRDGSAAKEQAQNERRRAKKCRGPQADYLNDPERPSLSSVTDEPYMQGSPMVTNPYNSETGLFERQPLTADAMIGSSGGPSVQMPNGQSVDELLVRAPRSAYVERRAPKSVSVNTMLVETAGPAKLTPSKLPTYFGAGLEEDGGEGFMNLARKQQSDGFANYNPSTADKEEYMMSPDFTQTFGLMGKDKAAGLPVPSVVDQWKRMTPSGAQSAFIDALPLPGGTYPGTDRPVEPTVDMKRQLDRIFSRLDDLENGKGNGENTQMEIFMFILSGMFVMFTIDAFARRR
jgi:hypothetical protein